MGNCADCFRASSQQDELGEGAGAGVPKHEATPPPVQVTQPARSARKYGSTTNKSKSTEKTPLLDNDSSTTDETSESVKKKHKKSPLKKLKQKLMDKKKGKGRYKDDGSSHSSQDETKSVPGTLSTADATRAAYKGTVERGDKLQDTEQRTASLAAHAKSLSENAKLIAEMKKKKSKP